MPARPARADGGFDWCDWLRFYDDGICDDWCPSPDPDCEVQEPASCGGFAGLTWGNACEASSMGTDVAAQGECDTHDPEPDPEPEPEQPACSTDSDCDEGESCQWCWGGPACVPDGALC